MRKLRTWSCRTGQSALIHPHKATENEVNQHYRIECQYSIYSGHLQRGISHCLILTRVKLCCPGSLQTFEYLKRDQTCQKFRLLTCPAELPAWESTWSTTSQSTFVQSRHSDKYFNFSTSLRSWILTVHILFPLEVSVFLPLYWKQMDIKLYLDCKEANF